MKLLHFVRAVALVGLALPALACAASQSASRWQAEFDAFSLADLKSPPRPGGVVFVGSSTIRLWDGLETQFERNVLKRGFGGSTLRECSDHVDRLVVAYAPRVVVVYAGENDLAEGTAPQAVLDSLQRFTERVRHALPEVHVAYVSIKPSPARQALLPQIRAANDLIREYVAGVSNAQFIDVHNEMLDGAGVPREELFREDRLHLNAAGYALWRRTLSAHLPD